MPKLFIANTTKQHHDFVYRPKIGSGGKTEDGVLKPIYGEMRLQHIPVGGQICVSGVSTDAEIRNILDQHKHIVEFKSLNRVRGFQGLCYRQDDPVPIEEILERLETNDKVRTEENKDRQAATALKIASKMREVASDDQSPFKDLHETNVQVAQKGDKEVNEGTPKLNQVVEVTEDGKSPTTRGRKSAA